MGMNFTKYFSVIAVSMIKFIGGPLTGLALKLSWIETCLCSIIGMMIMVLIVVFLSSFLQKFSFRKTPSKKFSKMSRSGIKIRQKFGLAGIAFLTPIFFTPLGGSILAMAFRYKKQEIIVSMLISAIAWGLVETFFFYYLREVIALKF